MKKKVLIARQLTDLIDHIGDQPVVIDGGCHHGAFSREVMHVFESPYILAFEPDPDAVERVRTNLASAPHIEIVAAALGSRMGPAEFFRGPVAASNSLLPRPNENSKPYYPEHAYLQGGYTVDVVTLDHECRARDINSIDLLKLDLQGGELMALEGARRLLADAAINVILVEAMFVRKYKEQPLLCHVWQYLESFGYTLHSLEEIKIGLYEKYDQGMRNRQWNQCDAFFVSKAVRAALDGLVN